MKRQAARWWAELPPAAGSAVMATGILSVGLELVHRHVLSLAAFALAALVWVLLAADFVQRLLFDRSRWTAEADTPPALTGVAATTVLGARLVAFGRLTAAEALLALAAALWPFLLVPVVRRLHTRMPGAVFLVCVATQGLAVLAGSLARAGEAEWLDPAALALFCLGLVLYLFALAHFDLRQVVIGAGDQWVAGGALAISALAASKLAASPQWTGDFHQALRITTLVLLFLDLAWCTVLLAAELLRPRMHYDIRRWSTVFPLGMTATASLSSSTATHVAWLTTLGRVALWIAVGAWLLTAVTFAAAVLNARRPDPDRSAP
ncbi:tellurite resistance/C4-dicarboxylate transporter family protein [Kitasatospora cinereorecta]|uniref:Tellurite resistance/C4-dicarboxylate transporter family protein n=1 Tax=Kitasatospora cinereorecta TaxID=285560 RepID=A0ABW0VD22_9ACTN